MTVVTPVSTLSKNNPWRVVSNFISGTVDVFDFTSAIHLLSYSLHVRYFLLSSIFIGAFILLHAKIVVANNILQFSSTAFGLALVAESGGLFAGHMCLPFDSLSRMRICLRYVWLVFEE